ncbi:Proline--tRNA ligase, partial [Bienertia sinuspersici]
VENKRRTPQKKHSEMTKIEWKFLVDHIGVMRSLRKRVRKQVKVGPIKRCLITMELKALLA